jgi:hypothetical protein
VSRDLRPGDGVGAPVATKAPGHQPIVPMGAGDPPRCTCGVIGGNGTNRKGDRPHLVDHLRQVDPTYGRS